MFQTTFVEEIKTHLMFNKFFFNIPVWDNVEKYGRARQATYGCTVHALCILGTQGYRHMLRIWNIYYFSTATMVTQMCLCVTFMRTLPVLLFLPLTYKVSALSDVLCLQASFTLSLYSLKFLKARLGNVVSNSSNTFILFFCHFVYTNVCLVWMPHWWMQRSLMEDVVIKHVS